MAINTDFLKKNEKLLSRILLFGAGYMLLVKPILEKINVLDSKEEKQRKAEEDAAKIDTQAGGSESPYSWAAFFKEAPTGVLIMTESTATSYVQKIVDGFQLWNVANQYNEVAAFGVLDALRTQSQFAWICRKYFLIYSVSLYEILKQNLTTKEFTLFNTKLMGKPKYK